MIEFDDGVDQLVDFLRATDDSYPTLACNLDLSEEPQLRSLLRPSKIVHLGPGNRIKVGVIGYVTPETKDLASTGRVVFLDEVESIRKEAEKLKRAGAKIIIALGHSGYEMDMKIAEEVQDVDVVVGGHTNTFLSNSQGEKPAPAGPYPTVVRQRSTGRDVLVVQTSGYGKYLGRLNVEFDQNGHILGYDGRPLLLDDSVNKDLELAAKVADYRRQVDEMMKVKVGEAAVFIDGGRPLCRLVECSFGDVVTDAMADQMDVNMAVINSGAIKGSFDKGK